MEKLSWSQMKTLVDAINPPIYSTKEDSNYKNIFIILQGVFFDCDINKSTSDYTEFQASYSSRVNLSGGWDSDGALIVRQKAAKKGWSFWAAPIEFTTSKINGDLYFKDSNGNDLSGVTCKIYDSSNIEITTPGTLGANLETCVKTVIDFEPTFDYEIIGGALRINQGTTADVRMWIVGAPDIPAQYGGSKEFASGVNLKFLEPDNSFEMDGRVSKFLTYNATTHSSKMRIILKHPAGTTINCQIVIHLFRA